MPKPTKHALALVSDSDFAVKTPALTSLQQTAIAQIAAVTQMESQAALCGVLAGITLHRVKASMKHGDFRPWLDNPNVNFGSHLTPSSRVKTANNLMRLASVFLESAKVTKPALLALPGDQTALDLGDAHPAKELMAKARKFVGDHSLTELLIKHEIKGVGLKTTLAAESANEDGDTPQTIEQARAHAWEESYAAVQRLRAAFTEPEQVQLLTDPAQIETLKREALEVSQLAEARLKALRDAKAA